MDHHTHTDRTHSHARASGHGHGPTVGRWARLHHRAAHLVTPHSHEAMDKVDSAMEASAEGMRTLWRSLAILGVTTVIQAAVVALSGSVALLGDTIHNAADALTAIPLGIAFVLGRRAATRRYTYGYGRAEDLAGIAIVLTIAASSALAAYEAVARLLNPATSRICGPSPSPRWSVSSGTSGWLATGSAPAGGSDRRLWWPTGCTPAPTASRRSPCCWERAVPRSAGGRRTRSSAC